MSKKHIELLAPGGDVDSIKAAIAAGADAVYCGLDRFNARNRAENISYDQLQGILHLAHKNNCQVFLTLNIVVIESELPAFILLLNKLSNSTIDGIILQDLGMLYLVKRYYKGLAVHASTQLTTHNHGQIDFLSRLGVTRVNLSRELHQNEITPLTQHAHQNSIMTEVFVHGSNCLSFSGLCYISSVREGRSGNRGRCSQPCRDQYLTTAAGKDFPLNLKDNSAYGDLASLAYAGVDSIKIEGRIKKFHYVYTVVQSYRQQLHNYFADAKLFVKDNDLYKVFNRGFSAGFLRGEIHRNMYIDNPRDNSALHRADSLSGTKEERLEQAKRQLYDEKTDIIDTVRCKIDKLSIDKIPLNISLKGRKDTFLQISIEAGNNSSHIESEAPLKKGPVGENTLDRHNFAKLLKNLNDSGYRLESILLDDLEAELQLPFNELTRIKRTIFSTLHNSQAPFSPVTLPRLKNHQAEVPQPSLSILISSRDDLFLCESEAEVYYELPACLEGDISDFINLFHTNKRLIPWFPAVIIGEHYQRAVDLLSQLQPSRIVTNNSGIAHEANKQGISWVAGPHLNLANSYSLLCLQKEFNCAGAFISNELNNFQVKNIKRPEGFELYYSIYHPITLMTSRQCLFHQVTGCDKDSIDNRCLNHCQKRSVLQTLKKESLIIDKQRGHYHTVYNNHNFLNTDIVSGKLGLFSSFFIDLRNIQTETTHPQDKGETARYFVAFLRGEDPSGLKLRGQITPTTCKQYIKGI